jgi:hypothetical protein
MNQPQQPANTTIAPPAAPPRRRGLKIVKWAVLLLILVVVGVGAILYVNLNRIVKHTVETQATASTNLKTNLGGARLALFGGSLDLENLEIGSPQGFAAPHMMTLGNASVKVNVNDLRGDPVKVASITLDKPKLVIERGAGGQFNFKAAADAMPKTDPAPADPNAKPLKLIIDELTIKDAVVIVRPGIPGLAQELTVPIPSINMKAIGSGEGANNGAAVKDVVMQVVTVLVAKASESGGLPDQLKQLMNIDLQGAVAQLGAEAKKRVAAAVPGELGQVLGNVISDPNALMKDPGAALKEGVSGQLGNLLGGGKNATQPTSQPADPAKKAVEEGLKGLLGGGKKKDEKKQ